MILVDFSQSYIAACMAFEHDFKKGSDTTKMEGIARHVILNMLRSYNTTYKKKYGELVICIDGKNTWRKAYFPLYKAHRKVGREESSTDWESIIRLGAQIREEIVQVFPYKVVNVEGAEGDDVIACILKHSQDNWLNQDGLEESLQEMLVISSDHDFRQLSKYRNYNQWSPIQKKVVPRADKNFIHEKVLRGDGGDGIASALCPDDFIVNHDKYGRAPSITSKILDAYLAKPDGSTLTSQQQVYLARNRTLIDFEYIPQAVYNNVIAEYENFEVVGTKNKVMEYFIKHRCKNLMQDIPAFF
jgi:hypothetical protein